MSISLSSFSSQFIWERNICLKFCLKKLSHYDSSYTFCTQHLYIFRLINYGCQLSLHQYCTLQRREKCRWFNDNRYLPLSTPLSSVLVELKSEIVSCIWNPGKVFFILCVNILAKLIHNLWRQFYSKLTSEEFNIKQWIIF